MNPIVQLLREFAGDDKLAGVLFLIVADFALGVGAALRLRTFRLAYVGAFLRDDILGKVVPWFALYSVAFFAGHVTLPVLPIDFGDVAGASYVVLLAAFTGSILGSVKDLGLPIPAALGGTTGSTNPPPPQDQPAP